MSNCYTYFVKADGPGGARRPIYTSLLTLRGLFVCVRMLQTWSDFLPQLVMALNSSLKDSLWTVLVSQGVHGCVCILSCL